MKKVIRYLFVFASIMGILLNISNTYFYADENHVYTEGDVQYILDNNAAFIVKYNGNNENVTIPFYYGTYEVKGIKPGAFIDTNIKKITVYDTMPLDGVEYGSVEEGVVIEFINAGGDVVNTHVVNNDITPSDIVPTNNEAEEFVEDIEIDIETDKEDNDNYNVDDVKEKRESRYNPFRNSVFSLFEGSNFASSFMANPIGYVLIALSFIAVVIILIRFFSIKK